MTHNAGWCVVSYGHRSAAGSTWTVLGEPTPARRQRDVVALTGTAPRSTRRGAHRRRGALKPGCRCPTVTHRSRWSVSKSFTTSVPPGAQVTWKVQAPPVTHLPLAAGQALGAMSFFIDGHAVGSRPLLADRSVAAPSWWQRNTARLRDAGPALPRGPLVASGRRLDRRSRPGPRAADDQPVLRVRPIAGSGRARLVIDLHRP